MAYWAVEVQPHKVISSQLPAPLHLKYAALGTDATEGQRVVVTIKYEDKNFVLCSLRLGSVEQVPLGLTFPDGEKISFSSTGGSAFLHGELISDEYPEDDESEEEFYRRALAGESLEDDDDDEEDEEEHEHEHGGEHEAAHAHAEHHALEHAHPPKTHPAPKGKQAPAQVKGPGQPKQAGHAGHPGHPGQAGQKRKVEENGLKVESPTPGAPKQATPKGPKSAKGGPNPSPKGQPKKPTPKKAPTPAKAE